MRQNLIATARVRALRQHGTEAERVLWHQLRGGRLLGLKVRRQVPLGPYIADFYVASARLVIEADGSQHAGSAADARRDLWLAARGYRILRLWNSDIMVNLPGTLARIAEEARP